MNYREVILSEFPDAIEISKALGIGRPDSPDSAGAMFLCDIRDTFIGEADEILTAEYPGDEASERADGRLEDDSTAAYWEIWTELALWTYDSELQANRTWSWAAIGGLAEDVMNEIAGQLYSLILNHVQQAKLDGEDSPAGDVILST